MTFSPSLSLESFTCRLVVPVPLRTVPGRKAPSVAPAPELGAGSVSQPSSTAKGRSGLRCRTLQRVPQLGLHGILCQKEAGSSPFGSQLLCTGETSLCSARRRCPSPVKPFLPPGWAVRLCFRGQCCRLHPHHSKWLRFQRHPAGGVKRHWAPCRKLSLCQEQLDPSLCRPPRHLPCLASRPRRPFAAAGAAGWSSTAGAAEPSEARQKIEEERIIITIIIKRHADKELKGFTFI